MWRKDQKSVCHCLIALLQKAQTRTQSRPHKPGWLNGRNEYLSLLQRHLAFIFHLVWITSDQCASSVGTAY